MKHRLFALTGICAPVYELVDSTGYNHTGHRAAGLADSRLVGSCQADRKEYGASHGVAVFIESFERRIG